MKCINVKNEDLPMEKIMTGKIEDMSRDELFAVIIGAGSRKENVFSLSERVANIRYDTKDSKDPLKFAKTRGIGIKTACKILACFEMTRRSRYRFEDIHKIDSPRDAAMMAFSEIGESDQEVLLGMFLDTKNKIIRTKKIHKGTLNYMAIHPRDIFRQAILHNSASIIISHNHPSGDTEPSTEDIDITTKIKDTSKIIGIPLLDHIIIGDGFLSMKEEGYIE